MKKTYLAVVALCLLTRVAWPEPAPKLGALARLPVREVTVFKDGHAFVLHQGAIPTDPGGGVRLDHLPTPVLGTFWPYSPDKDVKLTTVVASRQRVLIERTALSLREMIEANVGAEVVIKEIGEGQIAGPVYPATILAVPSRSADELDATGIPGADEVLPQKGNLVLLKTADGTKALPLERIQDVTFKDAGGKPPQAMAANEEFRNLLTLKLDWGQKQPEPTARVGLVYVQKGLRWIPGYKVVLDGKGNASLKLQATLINELADLDDVTANLVIGVPTFALKGTVDPIALQQTVAQLSPYFDADSQLGGQGGFSNAIMSQVAAPSRGRAAAPPPRDLGPEVGGGDKAEDLFVFLVKHVTLKKGERMVLPVADYTLKYKDVYTLDLPFGPPPEFQRNTNDQQRLELARLLGAPKFMHKIRLTNSSNQPLTTAPALVSRDERLLGQSLMTYTSAGGTVDLDAGTAVDIKVNKSDQETKRTPNAVNWQGDQYARVDLAGKIVLTNYRDTPVDLEVTRAVLGLVDSADQDGVIEQANTFEDTRFLPTGEFPAWWGWYSWPSWWSHVNGIGRVTWKTSLAPDKSLDLKYTWHYFWR